MSIAVVCTVCRTSMKVGEGFSEPKKIRCSGCGTVILLTPEPGNPSNVAVSFPRKKDKMRGLSENQKRIALYTIFGGFCLFFLYMLWWSNKAPEDKASVQGTVTLDDAPMKTGTIIFESLDGKMHKSTITVALGRYSISTRNGPTIGTNKVYIHSFKPSGEKMKNPKKLDEEIDVVADEVAKRFNEGDEQQKVEIRAGMNTYNFDVKSK